MEKELTRAIGYINLVLCEGDLWEDEATVLKETSLILNKLLIKERR